MERHPDVESVSCFLGVTATLAALLADKCLHANKESVTTKDALHALIDHPAAYTLICDYDYISDCVRILEDRITQAEEMLNAIADRELALKVKS